ncbi:MAG: glycosyltransferase [Myxococcales bacterium]|nr:glycosyltransferase [Myxococcales bacterium]
MNIVLLSNAMGRGGAEMQIKDYAKLLVRRGHRVAVVSMLPFEEFRDELRDAGVETFSLEMQRGKASAVALTKLVGLLIRLRPDVLHAHMFAAILASRIARAVLEPLRLAGISPPAIIGTSHSPFERATRRYIAYRVTDRFSDLWTNVCQAGVDEHTLRRAVRADKTMCTSNGVDVTHFAPDPLVRRAKRAELGVDDDTFLWLSVGSFRDDQKDYPNLLRAAAQLPSDRAWKIAIAGGGELLGDTRKLAHDLGLGDRVDILGLRSDVRELMQASDAFVLASWFEAMPIVLLEAAACALPCVVTDVGQNRTIVVEGTGLVVPPRDTPALSAAMETMLRIPADERHEIGQRARAHAVAELSLDVVVRAWEARYAEAASSVGRHVELPTPMESSS